MAASRWPLELAGTGWAPWRRTGGQAPAWKGLECATGPRGSRNTLNPGPGPGLAPGWKGLECATGREEAVALSCRGLAPVSARLLRGRRDTLMRGPGLLDGVVGVARGAEDPGRPAQLVKRQGASLP